MAERLNVGGEGVQDMHLQVAGLAIEATMPTPDAPAYYGDLPVGGPTTLEATVSGGSQTAGGATPSGSGGGRPEGGQRPTRPTK